MTTHDTTTRALHLLDDGSDGSLASQAFAINSSGAAVGVSMLDGRSRAVLWEPDGSVVDLTPGASAAVAEAISDAGTVVGSLGVGVRNLLQPPALMETEVVPFVWTRDGGLQVLTLPPGSEMGQAIDVHGDGLVLVTGAVPSSGGLPRGLPVGTFVYDLSSETYTPLPVVDRVGTDVIALGHTFDTNGGVSGGFVTLEGEFDWRHAPVVWEARSFQPTRLSGDDAFVNARSASGAAVGWRMTERGKPSTAVLWRDPSAMAELPGQAALRINDAGFILGIELRSDSPYFPFAAAMWHLDGSATRLDNPGAGSYGHGINARGDVVGYIVDAASTGGPTARAAVWLSA